MTANHKKLTKKFYTRDVHSVAKELLGKILVRKIGDKILAGKIVEVEAYDGKIDQAAHSFNGKTKRNEVMFNGGGNLYVYFTYGMHFCCNVVTGELGERTAILLRSLEPVEGIEFMAENRFGKKIFSEKEKRNLTNGPGKICAALKINREDNGTPLDGDDIYILNAPIIPKEQIKTSTRIGIKKSVDLPWRYYIKDNPYVSKK
jgi:DNA-3-methyladenine glycosylase